MRLQNDRLVVELADPGTTYRRTRFDWTGFMTQVTLDGAHTFFTTESDGTGSPSSDGAGLCNEFGIFAPIGYDEIAPGEQFPKLGVGVLTRIDDQPYSFMRDYPVTPYPIETQQQSDTAVTFTVQPLDCRGYAVRYMKTVTLDADTITIAYRMDNVGSKTVQTHEYNHNFLALDGNPVGPDYVMRLDFDPIVESLPEILTQNGREISWRAIPQGAFYCRPTGYSDTPVTWTMTHRPSGVGVTSTTDFPTGLFAFWGTHRTVAPEVFYQLDLAPGATAAWSRCYRFDG